MTRKRTETIKKKRREGSELAEILKRVPKEKHNEVYMLLEGFAVGCSEPNKKTG